MKYGCQIVNVTPFCKFKLVNVCVLLWQRLDRHAAEAQMPSRRRDGCSSLHHLALPLYTREVKIALGQINPTVGDFSGNAAKIIDFSRRAQAAGAGLILFPELSVCGYPPRDLVERPSFVARNRETAEQIAAETQGIAVICGLVTPAQSDTGKAVMNSAALLHGRQDRLHPVEDAAAHLRRLRRDAQLRSRQEVRNCFRSAAIAWR